MATTDGAVAYGDADFAIIAVPTNQDSQKYFFDCFAVEAVIQIVLDSLDTAVMVIKSIILVGYTESERRKFNIDRIFFCLDFLRECKVIYDNLYLSRIIVGCDDGTRLQAEQLAAMLYECALKENIEALFMDFTEAELKQESSLLILTLLFVFPISTNRIHMLRLRD